MKNILQSDYQSFLKEIKEKIYQAQLKAMKAVNHELLILYTDIGKLIVEKQENLGWGKSVVENLSHDLQKEFSGMMGFSARNLWLMHSFYLEYKDERKLQPLVAEMVYSALISPDSITSVGMPSIIGGTRSAASSWSSGIFLIT
jgi:hypothetical protein